MAKSTSKYQRVAQDRYLRPTVIDGVSKETRVGEIEALVDGAGSANVRAGFNVVAV